MVVHGGAAGDPLQLLEKEEKQRWMLVASVAFSFFFSLSFPSVFFLVFLPPLSHELLLYLFHFGIPRRLESCTLILPERILIIDNKPTTWYFDSPGKVVKSSSRH